MKEKVLMKTYSTKKSKKLLERNWKGFYIADGAIPEARFIYEQAMLKAVLVYLVTRWPIALFIITQYKEFAEKRTMFFQAVAVIYLLLLFELFRWDEKEEKQKEKDKEQSE